MIYVIGHKVPDTDSVCSAVAVAELKRQLGFEAEARVAGKINSESKFVLEKFEVDEPKLLGSAKGEEIVLVDHTDLAQAVDGVKEAKIVGIVDHHKLGDVETSTPLEALIRPLGCTCTIVKGLFDYYDKEIPRGVAGLMLCAILSDTVIFKSPTTTDEDKRAVSDLANIVGIDDYNSLGMDMFRVKSSVEGFSAKELVNRDYKDFDINGKKVGVGQLELVDLEMVKDVREDLLKEMGKMVEKGDREAVFLMLTDIMKEGTEMLCVSGEEGLRGKVFGGNGDGWYEGMMSRKKQVIPKLEEYFG